MADFDFTWAKKLADAIDPDGGWALNRMDYGFTVALASERDQARVWLSRVGCNIYGAYKNLNEHDDREKQLRMALEGHIRARSLGKAMAVAQ